MNQFLRPISEIGKWVSTEYGELRADPRSWANSRLLAIVRYIERRAKAFFTPRHLKRFTAEMIFGLVRAALIGGLIFVVLRLNFPEEINNFVLSLKPASQRDVHELHHYMESYQDYLNQKNDASGRYLTKEQELFNDIVQRVFPTKWNSGLITITESQTGGLNNGAVIPIHVYFPPFAATPHFYPILKNLNFGNQPDRTTRLGVTYSCLPAEWDCPGEC